MNFEPLTNTESLIVLYVFKAEYSQFDNMCKQFRELLSIINNVKIRHFICTMLFLSVSLFIVTH